jgi:hypothetical protein
LPEWNNNLAGLWDIGVGQSCKSFADLELSQKLSESLKNKFGEVPQHHENLTEVSGVDWMELSTKLMKMIELQECNYFK